MQISHFLYGACLFCFSIYLNAAETNEAESVSAANAANTTNNKSVVDSMEQIPEEGPKENVKMIKLVRDAKTNKYSCLHYYDEDSMKYFKNEGQDDIGNYLKRDYFRDFQNVNSIIFDGITFDSRVMSLLEQSGMGSLKIKSVLFNDCKIKGIGEGGLSLLLNGSNDLEGIKLGFSNSEEFPHKFLSDISEKCKQLNLLCLSFGKLNESDANVVANIITNNGKYLRNLYLVIKQADAGVLKVISDSLKNISELNSLSVSFGNVPCEDVNAFFKNISVKNLKIAKVDLDMGLYNTEGLYSAAESVSTFLKSQNNLEELDISGSNVSDDCYAKIFQDVLPGKQKLGKLKMDNIKITEKNVEELSKGISELPALSEVSFKGCHGDDKIFSKIIASLETLPSLKILDLDDNMISTGLSGIIQKCANLINLSVRNNKLTSESALDMIKVSFDKSRNTQILINMIGNSLDGKKPMLHNEYTKLTLLDADNKPKSFILL